MIRALLKLSIDNPVLVNLIFFVAVLGGVVAWQRLPKEEFPQVRTDRVVVFVAYPGAAPADVEDQVVRPIEDALGAVDGIAHVFSDALEGRALLDLELTVGAEIEEVREAVQRAVDGVDGLPDDTLTPVVRVAAATIPLIHVALTGDTRQLDLADELAAELMGMEGVAEVRVLGADERRLRVVPEPRLLAARGVGVRQIAEAVRAAGIGAPAGSVVSGEADVLVRTQRGLERPADLASVPLRITGESDLRVGDLARVQEEWVEPAITHRVDGQPAIVLMVLRTPEADALRVVPLLHAWAEQRASTLPAGLGLRAYDDSARMVRHRIQILASNGLVGMVLVAAVLVLFIGWRNAALVVWGLPVAYAGALMMMVASGTTVNIVSTFALLLVVGIIVDDAIVIVENVQRHLEQGKDRVSATLDGTSEVFGAVISATLTTCLAFGTLYGMEGILGRVMAIVPTVVALSLLASTLEAFFVLPGHLAHYAEEREAVRENLPTRLLRRAYEPLVRAATERGARWWVLGALVVLLLGVEAVSAGMRRTLSTPGSPVFALVNVSLPPGASPRSTRAVVREVEAELARRSPGLLLYVASRVGEQADPQDFPTWGDRQGQVKVGFHDDPAVLERVPEVLEGLRGWLEARPDLEGFAIQTLRGGPPAGKPIDLRVRSRDEQEVEALVGEVISHLRARPGVLDVRTEAEPGAPSYEVQVDAAAAARFGLREGQIALAVRDAVDGQVAHEFSVQERTAEVRVALPALASPDDLGDLPIALADGRSVRLRQVAAVVPRRDGGKLHRVDGQRAVRVFAEVDPFVTTGEQEKIALDAQFEQVRAAGHPRASLFYGGEIADLGRSFANVPAAVAASAVLMYLVLAVQFQSYLQPVVILSAVPLGLAGAVLGLFVLGMDLSFLAAIGSVALTGIVVNDSLVLVDFINLRRAEGIAPRQAVIEASLTRLRPILITTVTTVLGLLPLALGVAGKEPLLAPMAVSISFGLTFATALTLVVVPVLYLVVDDVGRWLAGLLPAGR